MKVRQIYDKNKRIAAFAGSIGIDKNNPASMTMRFSKQKLDDAGLSWLCLGQQNDTIILEVPFSESELDNTQFIFEDDDITIIYAPYIEYGDEFSIDASTYHEDFHVIDKENSLIAITHEEDIVGSFEIKYHSIFIDGHAEITSKENAKTFAEDEEAVRQYLLQHLCIIKNELWYNYTYGLPLTYKNISKAMIDAEAISIITSCPDVVDLIDFDSSLSNHNYTMSFKVDTRFGKIEISDTF